jgi:hypothetical protein
MPLESLAEMETSHREGDPQGKEVRRRNRVHAQDYAIS